MKNLHSQRKPIKWIGPSKKDLNSMPEDVKDFFGFAIDVAQTGGKHPDAKPLKGFGSAGVLEVIENNEGGTYRAIYTVKFLGWIYVLHCFQKKSMSGISTPKQEIDLIYSRLADAKIDHSAWLKQK